MSAIVMQPETMTCNLYPHQLSAIFMMEQRESLQKIDRHTFSIECKASVYADIAGYGKTLAILGLICRDKMPWDLQEDYIHTTISSVYGHGSIVKRSLMRFKKIKTTLVVASTSILKQWADEIDKTTLRYTIITHRRKADVLDPPDYDIVLVSPSLYNYVLDRFPSYAWKRFIFDEPTQTKIPAMRQVIAGFTWFISGTPYQLLFLNRSNHNYLSTLFSNCMDYNLFKYLIVKNDDSFVKESFALPDMHHEYHECHQPVYKIIKNLISDNICQMIAAGNIERAIKLLGGNSTDSIINLIETEKLELIKEAELKMERAERQQDIPRLEKWRERRERLCEQLEELRKRFRDHLNHTQCLICLNSPIKPILLSCCQNLFCGECVLTWLQKNSTCPLCRKPITPTMMNYIREEPDIGQQAVPVRKTKPEKIIDIIHSREKGKFIIFSCYDETLGVIRESLHDHQIEFTEISGTMMSRSKKIENFKYGEMNVLFMNSMSNGAGINLQEATDVILYHKMPEDLEVQIIGRAYRIGRVQPLTIHHLI